jgi:hypothetical protein
MVAPVMGMSVESFEFMTAHADEVPISILIADWISSDPSFKTPYILMTSDIDSLLGERKNAYVVQRYHKLMDESVRQMFPAEARQRVEVPI